MAKKVWGDSIRPQFILSFGAIFVAAALGAAAIISRPALISMAVIIPPIVIRFLVDVWLNEQRKKKALTNAAAIQRWLKIGTWVYLGFAIAACVAIVRLKPGW